LVLWTYDTRLKVTHGASAEKVTSTMPIS
jgi:hypothetical protein